MSFENGFLRVKVPVTTDGVMLAYDSNKQPMYKEVHLPLQAKKFYEAKNKKRPPHLKHIIEVVNVQPAQRPLPTDDVVMSKAALDELLSSKKAYDEMIAKIKPEPPQQETLPKPQKPGKITANETV